MILATCAAILHFAFSQNSTTQSLTKLTEATNLKGETYSIELASAKATVILFVATDCPVANRYAPEIERITKEYKPKGVQVFRIYLDQVEDADEVLSHSKEFSLTSTPLLDSEQKLVRRLKALVTPEAFLLLPTGEVAYRGRIDDVNIEHGKVRENYRRDLRIALDEVLSGKPVSVPETAAIGCLIPPPGSP